MSRLVDIQGRLLEWEAAQKNWPHALLCGQVPATIADCERWLVEIGQWLQWNGRGDQAEALSDAQILAIQTFRSRVHIQLGDLRSDAFKCSLGECG